MPAATDTTDTAGTAGATHGAPACGEADVRGGLIASFAKRCPADVLETLLCDRTTDRNIVWADDEHVTLGAGFGPDDEMTVEHVTGEYADTVLPRTDKGAARQALRTKTRAEVFTPSWLCNRMNNWLDAEWFGRTDAFNTERLAAEDGACGWAANGGQVALPHSKGRGIHAYIERCVLEISCGEAPFLCSRYDAATGVPIPVRERMGLLDRKLRVVGEHARTRGEWTRWALDALRATYGYEYQGDNLLLARVNTLEDFREHCQERWGEEPGEEELLEAVRIVSWNLWQMDGLTCAVPTGTGCVQLCATLGDCVAPETQPEQLSLFDLSAEEAPADAPRKVPLCVIYDWQHDEPRTFAALKGSAMGTYFYAVIGNPPYQEEVEGTSDRPIYNDFMDSSYEVGEKVELVTPGRFLFNAGKTPKKWNKKMLADPHLKVLEYTQKSADVFDGVDIKGGVAITYRDAGRTLGPIEVFSAYEELRSILRKVKPSLADGNISSLMYLQNRFDLEALYEDYPEARNIISSEGRERRIVTSSFNKLGCFTDEQQNEDDIRIFGLTAGNKRTYKWIRRKYVEDNGNLGRYKVILPMANGSGAIGEVLSTPLIGEPLIGYTQSFMGIGSYEARQPAEAVLKYIKTKLARTLLGILKITQHNTPEKWVYVPLQDFTSSSDIDWSQSVAEIDRQLYAKYGLSSDEIEFIETHVKEMS